MMLEKMPTKNRTANLQSISPYLFWALIAIVTTLLLVEQRTSIGGFLHLDKIIHAIIFASLTAIGYLAYSKHSLWLYLGLSAYGIITEFLQDAYTITRHASIYDWMADTAGILLCILVLNILKKQSTMKTQHVR